MMASKFTAISILCILSLALSGCLESEGNLFGNHGGSEPPASGGDDSGGGSGGGSGGDSGGGSGGDSGGGSGGDSGGGSGGDSGGDSGGGSGGEPGDPPTNTLTSIPDVTFDYMKEPGATTTSGSLPSTIGAGEVLEFTGQTASDDVRITCEGTEENPAFIVGGTLSGANDVFYVSGGWCYFVGTVFQAIQPRTNGANHIVFRDVEVTGSMAKNGMNLGGSNIVVTGSEIHHNQRTGNDAHGIQVTSGASNVWILDNHIHHNSGNGIQACHGCSASPPSGIFIGNNLFHSDREVGVGLKYADNVIIEGNIFHSYKSAQSGAEFCFDDGSVCGTWNSGSDGNTIVVGSDNDVTGLTRVVIVGNEMYASNGGIRIEESDGAQILDNNIHDISRNCLTLDKNGENTLFQGNTCRNASRGIHQHWRDNFSLTVDQNVFENISSNTIEYESRNVCDDSTLTSNQFISSGPIVCGNTTATTTAGVNALPGAADNTVE